MTRTHDEVAAQLAALDDLPYTEWVAPAEEAHRAATELGDDHLLWWADLRLWTAWEYSGGRRSRSLPYFARMVAQLDRQPEWWGETHTFRTLWAYKAAVTTALSTPEISLDQVEGLLASMRAHYARFGRSDRSVLMTEYRIRRHTHGHRAADELFRAWTELPRDDLSDCEGCEPSTLADHAAALGNWREAAMIAEFVIDETALHCSEQPQHICAIAVEPLLRTGDTERARWAHLLGTRISGTNPHDTLEMARQVGTAARAGEPLRALRLIEARRLLDFGDDAAELRWLTASALALGILCETDPELAVGIHREDTETATAALARVRAEAVALAERFDRRNGTDAVSARVREEWAADPLPPLGLPVTGLERVRPDAAREDLDALVQDPIAADARRREIRDAGDDLALVALGAAWIRAALPDPEDREALVAAAELDWVAGFVHLRRDEPDLLEEAQQRGLRRLRAAGRDAHAALWELFRLRPPVREVDDEALAAAEKWWQQAVQDPDPVEVARGHQAYAEVLHAGQRPAEAVPAYVRALGALPDESPASLQLRARIRARQAWLPDADSDRLLAEALADAEAAGAPTALLLAQVAQFRLASGHPDAAESLCRFLDRAGIENDFAAWGAVPMATHPAAASVLDRSIPAVQRIVTRAKGTPEGWQALRVLADLSLRDGRLLEAAELVDEGLRVIDAGHLPAAERGIGEAHLHLLGAQVNDGLGDVPRAAHHARAFLAATPDEPSRSWALVLIAQHSGLAADWEVALEAALAEADPANASEALQGAVIALRKEHGPGPALDLLARIRPRLTGLTDDPGFAGFATGVCEHWRARMLADQGDPTAESAFAEAAEAFERAAGPDNAVRVRIEHGDWLLGLERPNEAADVLQAAAESAQTLGWAEGAARAAYHWSEALVELGRHEEAADVRTRFGLAE